MLKLALAAVDVLGVRKPAVRIGDSALFAAVLDALDLSLPWRKRLARSFGDSARLQVLLKRLAGEDTAERPDDQGIPDGLAAARRSAVVRFVDERLADAGIGTAEGRTAREIADRFIEKAALAAASRFGGRAPKTIRRYLSITGDAAKAVKALRAFARAEKLDVGKAVDQFEARAAGFAKHGVDLSRLSFAADFGRRLDYYTGFVFEIHAPGETRGQIVGGGRYDRLVSLIPRSGRRTAGESVPAIGFSIWLDRIGQAK
jgi:ATP phosphoribosyltransferase regulatory subunit